MRALDTQIGGANGVSATQAKLIGPIIQEEEVLLSALHGSL